MPIYDPDQLQLMIANNLNELPTPLKNEYTRVQSILRNAEMSAVETSEHPHIIDTIIVNEACLNIALFLHHYTDIPKDQSATLTYLMNLVQIHLKAMQDWEQQHPSQSYKETIQ